MTTDNLVEVNCEIPMQCELIDKDENRDMVTHVLKEDAKFLKFITTFTGTGKWSYVINNGVISQLPLVYFYFIKYKYVASTGKRTFMLLNCSCSFKTIANIPYCGCETLCSEIIPKQFGDAGRMCSSDVLFCDSK
jgi:hypothetical protein